MLVRLSDLAEIRSGSVPKVGVRAVVYLQARHLRGGCLSTDTAVWGSAPVRSAERARIVEGDVLINARGRINQAVVVDKLAIEAYASLDLAVVRPDRNRLLPAYLAAFVNLPSTQTALAGHRTTGVLPRLPLDAIAALPVPLPSLERQAAIAALAAEARRERETLEALMKRRQSLLDEILRRAAEGAPMPSWLSTGASAGRRRPEKAA